MLSSLARPNLKHWRIVSFMLTMILVLGLVAVAEMAYQGTRGRVKTALPRYGMTQQAMKVAASRRY